MTTDTKDKILKLVRQRDHVRVIDLVRYLGFSSVAVHKQVKRLMERGQLVKNGKPPLVFYSLSAKPLSVVGAVIDQ